MEIAAFPKYEKEELVWNHFCPCMTWQFISDFTMVVSLKSFEITRRDAHCTVFPPSALPGTTFFIGVFQLFTVFICA